MLRKKGFLPFRINVKNNKNLMAFRGTYLIQRALGSVRAAFLSTECRRFEFGNCPKSYSYPQRIRTFKLVYCYTMYNENVTSSFNQLDLRIDRLPTGRAN